MELRPPEEWYCGLRSKEERRRSIFSRLNANITAEGCEEPPEIVEYRRSRGGNSSANMFSKITTRVVIEIRKPWRGCTTLLTKAVTWVTEREVGSVWRTGKILIESLVKASFVNAIPSQAERNDIQGKIAKYFSWYLFHFNPRIFDLDRTIN